MLQVSDEEMHPSSASSPALRRAASRRRRCRASTLGSSTSQKRAASARLRVENLLQVAAIDMGGDVVARDSPTTALPVARGSRRRRRTWTSHNTGCRQCQAQDTPADASHPLYTWTQDYACSDIKPLKCGWCRRTTYFNARICCYSEKERLWHYFSLFFFILKSRFIFFMAFGPQPVEYMFNNTKQSKCTNFNIH